jgi:hypothetical protein
MKLSANTILLPLGAIADRLNYVGRDRERSVRRLFAKLGVPIVKRSRGVYFVTEEQYEALIEAMTCSPSEGAAKISICAGRSVSGAKNGSSRSILAAQIAETLRKPTVQSSKRKSDTKCFTVVEGGRTG